MESAATDKALVKLPPILVLSSPSGGGKTTQRNMLMAKYPNQCEFAVSYTTRLPRSDEVDGVDYHFLINKHLTAADLALPKAEREEKIATAKMLAEADFEALVEKGIFLEHVHFYGNCYGTSRAPIEKALAEGRTVIADVNLDGLRAFKQAYPDQVTGVFLNPPSLEELKARLVDRNITSQGLSGNDAAREMQSIEERMKYARTIIDEGLSGAYPHVIQSMETKGKTFAALLAALTPLPKTTIEAGGGALSPLRPPPQAAMAA